MIPDWQERTLLMTNDKTMYALASKHVLVAGMGGVGAYVAEMLCRAGIGELTIADNDIVQPSNINRQLIALHSTIGKSKVDLMQQRLMDINPALKLHTHKIYIKDEAILELLQHPYDYVVDAIDTLSPKIYLIYHAFQKNFPIVSSMGAGGKLDPTKIQVVDLSKTNTCRFAFDVRKRLRRMGVTTGIQTVFSTEVVSPAAIKLLNEQNKKSTVGTMSYLPAAFGCACASVVIRDLIEEN